MKKLLLVLSMFFIVITVKTQDLKDSLCGYYNCIRYSIDADPFGIKYDTVYNLTVVFMPSPTSSDSIWRKFKDTSTANTVSFFFFPDSTFNEYPPSGHNGGKYGNFYRKDSVYLYENYSGHIREYYGKRVKSLSLEENTLIIQSQLFPNPTNDAFTINCNSNITQVIIRDISGRQIINQQVGTKTAQLNLEQFPKGMYFIEAKTTNGTVTQKLVKK